MAKGVKTGGRKKGTANKDKQELLDMIRREVGHDDYHPVVEMAKVACADLSTADPETRARLEQMKFNANREVAQYVAPKLKAVEVTGTGDDGSIHVTIRRFSAGAG